MKFGENSDEQGCCACDAASKSAAAFACVPTAELAHLGGSEGNDGRDCLFPDEEAYSARNTL